MKIGIGLPNSLPGVDGAALLEWARRAEDRGFSTLATIDRLVYDSYDPGCSPAPVSRSARRPTPTLTLICATITGSSVLGPTRPSLRRSPHPAT
jgi:hypothetical protein